MVIPILEDKEAIEKAEEIFAELKPGVDAAIFGHGDLAHSLRQPGQTVNWNDPYINEAFEKMLLLSRETGVPIMGMPRPEITPECAKAVLNKGIKILMYYIDQLLFYDLCLDIVRSVKG